MDLERTHLKKLVFFHLSVISNAGTILKAHSHRASTPTLNLRTPFFIFPIFDAGDLMLMATLTLSKLKPAGFIPGNVAVTLTLTSGVNGPNLAKNNFNPEKCVLFAHFQF